MELDNAEERVIPFKAINLMLSNGRTALVHNGEFIQHQLDVSLYHGCYNDEINYFSTQDGFALGQLLMSYRSPSEGDCCLVRPYDPVTIPDGTIIRNELDCPLVERDNHIISLPPQSILRSVSIVHECLSTCVFREMEKIQTVERECVKLIFEHDWSNPHYCWNKYCIS